MSLQDLSEAIPDLSGKSHSDKIKLFGWYLHATKAMTHFQPADVAQCYGQLHLAQPSGFGGYFAQLVKENSLLKNTSGYRLEKQVRVALDKKYGTRETTILVTNLLHGLPNKIPDLAERTYLNEALICFKHGAKRAAVVMTWNLAYHHLCDYVLRKHLPAFNARWQVVYQGHHKKGAKTITQMSDFGEELKESEVLTICKSAGIITNDQYKILEHKLGRRNSAAHPSEIVIDQPQVEDFISDLITNVVLKLT